MPKKKVILKMTCDQVNLNKGQGSARLVVEIPAPAPTDGQPPKRLAKTVLVLNMTDTKELAALGFEIDETVTVTIER